jgi:acyl-coenzyme A synthetase/AMP-(fatty) acid ligase
MNIFIPIRRNAQAFPDRVALVIDGAELTYGQLLRATGLVAARLAERGLTKGDCVALSVTRPGHYLLLALSLARLGVTVAPFDVRWPAEQGAAVLARHKPRALITDDADDWRHPSLPEGGYLNAKDLVEAPAAGSTINVPQVAADVGREPWVIALSSGTTGAPKSIPHSHDRAVLYACMIAGQVKPTDHERLLVFTSLHLSMAMNMVLPQLFLGRAVILVSDRRPESFFAAVERDRPTCVSTSTGNMIAIVAYAAASRPDSLAACKSVHLVKIAGSTASPALRAQIAQHICPNLQIIYGSSEAAHVAEANAQTLVERPGSAGRLYPWVEMEAVDANGQTLPAGRAGVLRMRSPLLVSGYAGEPEATERAFRGGWYYPGDTGHVDAAGYLTLTGRVDELLNLGGNKIDPGMIEAVLDAQPGVQESVVVAVTGAQGIPVLIGMVVTSGAFDEEGLKKACLEQLGAKYVPRRIRRTDGIPRNAGGKIMRKEITERVAKMAPKQTPSGQEG